jgi:hypothetical protein
MKSNNTRAKYSTRFTLAATTGFWNASNVFDGAKLSAGQLAVTQAELLAASIKADESLRAAVAEAEKNIATFAKKSLRKNWRMKNSHGASVGEKFDPFQRVGIYIPGGTAPLVSTALMTVTLAQKSRAARKSSFARRAARMVPSIRAAVRRAGGGRDGDLPRGRRAGDCGAGLRHKHNPPRAERFLVRATPTSSRPSDCSSAMLRLICCPARAKCWCWRTTRRIRNSPPPICWHRLNTVPATSASGS